MAGGAGLQASSCLDLQARSSASGLSTQYSAVLAQLSFEFDVSIRRVPRPRTAGGPAQYESSYCYYNKQPLWDPYKIRMQTLVAFVALRCEPPSESDGVPNGKTRERERDVPRLNQDWNLKCHSVCSPTLAPFQDDGASSVHPGRPATGEGSGDDRLSYFPPPRTLLRSGGRRMRRARTTPSSPSPKCSGNTQQFHTCSVRACVRALSQAPSSVSLDSLVKSPRPTPLRLCSAVHRRRLLHCQYHNTRAIQYRPTCPHSGIPTVKLTVTAREHQPLTPPATSTCMFALRWPVRSFVRSCQRSAVKCSP